MAMIPVGAAWAPVDVDAMARNWRASGDRLINNVAALYALQRGVNFVAARCGRVNALWAMPFDQRSMTSSEPSEDAEKSPAYAYLVPDTVTNARSRRIAVQHAYRESDPSPTSDAYFQRTSDSGSGHSVDAVTKSATYNHALGRSVVVTDTGHVGATYNRGNAPASEIIEGIATFGDFSPYGWVVQDEQLYALDPVTHGYVSLGVSPGNPVLGAYHMQQISDELDDVRQKNMPVLLNWFAHAFGGVYSSPAGSAGSITAATSAITVRTTTLTNVLDQSSTSWSSSSPGFQTHVQYHGIGNQAKPTGDGDSVKVTCRVLARPDASYTGSVRFEGASSSTSSASSDITVAPGGSLGWYGSDSNYFYLDSSVANDATGATRNKVDVFAQIGNTLGTLQIYAIMAWMIYGV